MGTAPPEKGTAPIPAKESRPKEVSGESLTDSAALIQYFSVPRDATARAQQMPRNSVLLDRNKTPKNDDSPTYLGDFEARRWPTLLGRGLARHGQRRAGD